MSQRTTFQSRVAEQNEEESRRSSNSAKELLAQHPVKKQDGDTRISVQQVAAATLSPALAVSLALIFGGCCSNVYTLESILSLSPVTGTLVTGLQFLLTSLFTLKSQLTYRTDGSSSTTGWLPRLRARTIPLRKWTVYTALFLAVNMLNNMAFKYRISMPMHIILRSAGPVTSMFVGYTVAKRRYTPRQILAVMLLFAGVVLAALSDARAKSRRHTSSSITPTEQETGEAGIQAIVSAISETKLAEQLPGFALLFSALLLSALMGIYTDKMYDQHGRNGSTTSENLFYSHALSLPFFALQAGTMRAEFNTLATRAATFTPSRATSFVLQTLSSPMQAIRVIAPDVLKPMFDPSTLTTLGLLFANALTQIVCITGVNGLSTQTTSLTVTIVLNIRKLVSLLLSIWLFGNSLPFGVACGASLVFLGGLLYGWKGRSGASKSSSSLVRELRNGSVKKRE